LYSPKSSKPKHGYKPSKDYRELELALQTTAIRRRHTIPHANGNRHRTNAALEGKKERMKNQDLKKETTFFARPAYGVFW
jgi:glutamine synthetase adenylyltransferase